MLLIHLLLMFLSEFIVSNKNILLNGWSLSLFLAFCYKERKVRFHDEG